MWNIARLIRFGLLALLAAAPAARADGFGACTLWGQGVFVQWTGSITNCSSITTSTPVTPFVPRGMNFIRLLPDSNNNPEHETLQPCDNNFHAPKCYTTSVTSFRSDLSSALSALAKDGYNVVRLTLDSYDLFNDSIASGNSPISPGFVTNLHDALNLIHTNGMLAILTISNLPTSYAPPLSMPQQVAGVNADVMDPAAVSARGHFWSDLIGQLEALGTLNDGSSIKSAIFAIDVRNEAHFSNDTNYGGNHPFDLTYGSVTWSGHTYNLSDFSTGSNDTTGRQALANAATLNFFSTIRSMIPSSILITASTVTPLWSDPYFKAFNGLGFLQILQL